MLTVFRRGGGWTSETLCVCVRMSQCKSGVFVSSEVRGIGVRSDAGVSACALLHEEEHQRAILSSVGSGCHDTATLGGALGSV